ncbi:MAG: hypothetical protein K9J17_14640 [Flavobacteriales bacterium]|nr:hypothetical protein [Flavobacteriales bacterium]
MKTLRNFGILMLASVSISIGIAQAQTPMYSSPEPTEQSPIQVKKSDAISEATSVSKTCGYNQAYISIKDLEALLSPSSCVGIRIYNAKESSDQQNSDIIAVAVDQNGKEIGSTSKYLNAKSYDENQSCPSRRIGKSKAVGCVKNITNSSLNYQKVFFSKAVLKERISVSGMTGIMVIPGELSGGSTMMICAAALDGGKLTALEANFLKSQLPCPTDCGDSGNYLVEPK